MSAHKSPGQDYQPAAGSGSGDLQRSFELLCGKQALGGGLAASWHGAVTGGTGEMGH